jgi:ATP-dependent DNA helicase RecQ
VRTILRQNGGFFSFKTPVQLPLLSKKTGISIVRIRTLLKELEHLDVINLNISNQDTTITFLAPREDDHTINRLIPYIKQQYENKKQKINAVLKFVADEKQCKTIELLNYFGERKKETCGRCSYCLSQKQYLPNSKEVYRDQMKLVLKELKKGDKSSRELSVILNIEAKKLLPVLSLMLDKKIIKLTENNNYKHLL